MNIVGILERCGVGGIKFGKFASTRYDLLPAGWIEQLSRLRKQNRPVRLQLDERFFFIVHKKILQDDFFQSVHLVGCSLHCTEPFLLILAPHYIQ